MVSSSCHNWRIAFRSSSTCLALIATLRRQYVKAPDLAPQYFSHTLLESICLTETTRCEKKKYRIELELELKKEEIVDCHCLHLKYDEDSIFAGEVNQKRLQRKVEQMVASCLLLQDVVDGADDADSNFDDDAIVTAVAADSDSKMLKPGKILEEASVVLLPCCHLICACCSRGLWSEAANQWIPLNCCDLQRQKEASASCANSPRSSAISLLRRLCDSTLSRRSSH